MASWTALPIDIKSKVVEKLDLLTRCRLKISSRSNQELVNSMPLTIKHARIGLGDDACLLMVHTGIGKFVKLDMEKIEGKVVIKRLINSRKVSNAKKIPTDHKDPFVPLCQFIKSLLTSASYNIYLNTLELECNPLKNEEATVEEMEKLLNGVEFRAKKLLHQRGTVMGTLISSLCMKEDLKETDSLTMGLMKSSSLSPDRAMKMVFPKYLDADLPADDCISKVFYDGVPRKYRIGAETYVAHMIPGTYAIHHIRFFDPKSKFERLFAPIERVSYNVLVKRIRRGDLVFRYTLTPCGYLLIVIHESKEHTIDWSTPTSRRVLHKPKWLNIFKDDFDDELIQRHVRLLKLEQSFEEIHLLEKQRRNRKAKKALKRAALKKEKADEKHND